MENTPIKLSTSKIIFIIIILVLAGGAGYYIWNDLRNIENNQNTNNLPINNNPDSNLDNNDTCVLDEPECDDPDNDIQLPDENSDEILDNIPDLDKPINITADLPEDAKQIAIEKINTLRSELKENSDLFNNWLNLGIYYKMIGDYDSTIESWEYAKKIRPYSSTPFNNLGDFYGYYLKDKQKAEENFLKALELDPQKPYLYRTVHEFYRYVMKDDNKAKEILRKGIELNPETSQDLQYLLKNYNESR